MWQVSHVTVVFIVTAKRERGYRFRRVVALIALTALVGSFAWLLFLLSWGSANPTEPSQRRSCIVPIPHTLRNDGGTRFALARPISKPSHLVLERVDAFADAAVARCR